MSAKTLGYGHPCTSHVQKAWGELKTPGRNKRGKQAAALATLGCPQSRDRHPPDSSTPHTLKSNSDTQRNTPKACEQTCVQPTRVSNQKRASPKNFNPNVRGRVCTNTHGGPPHGAGGGRAWARARAAASVVGLRCRVWPAASPSAGGCVGTTWAPGCVGRSPAGQCTGLHRVGQWARLRDVGKRRRA